VLLSLKDKHCLPDLELRVKTLEMHRGRGGTPPVVRGAHLKAGPRHRWLDHRSLFGSGDMAELRRLSNLVILAAWLERASFSFLPNGSAFTQQKEQVRYKRFWLPTLG
jgi:hypothetical protein